MASFGSWGGVAETIPFAEYAEDLFAVALERACGEKIRADDKFGIQVWAALANVDWQHLVDGHDASYSWRGAGDLLASIRGSGNYMDYYCRGDHGNVEEWIADAMAAEGWTVMEDDDA